MNVNIDTIQNLGLTQPAPEKPRDELGQKEFLKLLTAQLNNQDPFKPLESGEFLGQIAQFGTVAGIQDLQKSFSNFASSVSSDQALQAAQLVGRQVLIEANQGVLTAGGQISGELTLPGDAAGVAVDIYNLNGELVRSIEMGPHKAGRLAFNWDGVLDDESAAQTGSYFVKGTALIDGENQGLLTHMRADVESVTLGHESEGVRLNLVDLGSINFNDIQRIL